MSRRSRPTARRAYRTRLGFALLGPALILSVTLGLPATSHGRSQQGVQPGEWPAYGRDPGGARNSPLRQIDRGNVAALQVAWTYRTGDVSDGSGGRRASKFEATPIMIDGRLYLSTPFNRVIALDAATGRERWTYDPEIDQTERYSEGLVSRGVSYWADPSVPEDSPGTCAHRIFLGTLDARLIALDARTGRPCRDFGREGQVDLTQGIGEVETGEYQVTSPPAVIGDRVIVGSAQGDNRRVEVERGVVRAFDTRTGELQWSWDPIPRSAADPAYGRWTAEAARRTGAANVWSIMSVDPERELVFVPTTSPAPDFYGGERPGRNDYANSLVALRAATGEVAWHFQTTHHDLWDFDLAAQPLRIDLQRDGERVPALVVATKMGFLFVLHGETGEPLFPVEERPVPQTDVPGEVTWPTQPFPVVPPPLHPTDPFTARDAWGLSDGDRRACQEAMAGMRSEGIYTPPGLAGTVYFPGNSGGINWGGAAFHEGSATLVTIVNRLAGWVRLHPRSEYETARRGGGGAQFTGQEGTPYGMSRATLLSPKRLPCNPPPWGTLTAVDLGAGTVKWEVPLGIVPALADVPGADEWGSIGIGGPIVTAGGLAFVGAAMDDAIRAFDLETGDELWRHELPAGGQATPMTYEVDGVQYIVIAAGGHSGLGTTLGDYVVAFALPDDR